MIVLFTLLLITNFYLYFVLRRERYQIKEIAEALADIKEGNGNRRILTKSNELLSPLVYGINDIVSSYENHLANLKHTDEANRQLMTSLSHDVRTPLTTLIGYLDAIQKGFVSENEHENYLRAAQKKAYNLKEYIDVLFDWFKLGSNELAMIMENVDLAELTRNILIDWIPLLEEQNIIYSINTPDKPVIAYIDQDFYLRILNNLMQNVFSHSQANNIQIDLKTKVDKIELSINDNGVGIAEKDLKLIFSRLFKCDEGRSKKGSGLGLSIAYQLAQKMKGSLWAISNQGNGTTFFLSLPLVEQEFHLE